MQVHRERPALDRAGLRLVMIGNGPAWIIDEFRHRLDLDVELYTDPDRRSFRALDFSRSILRAMSLAPVPTAIRAYRSGFRQRVTQGDPFQMGGVAVVSSTGELLFRYASKHASDYPMPVDVLSNLDHRELEANSQ